MSRKYKIQDQQDIYFVTFTVVHWIDVFIRNAYKEVFVDSVKFCQSNKGLEVYAWCIMTSHIHMICGSDGKNPLQGILRDIKSFTSRYIRKLLEDKESVGESRREWILWMMKRAGQKNGNNNDFQFWQQDSHPVVVDTNEIMDQKLEYLHMNPVEAGFVDRPEGWSFSSAGDYILGRKGLIDLKWLH